MYIEHSHTLRIYLSFAIFYRAHLEEHTTLSCILASSRRKNHTFLGCFSARGGCEFRFLVGVDRLSRNLLIAFCLALLAPLCVLSSAREPSKHGHTWIGNELLALADVSANLKVLDWPFLRFKNFWVDLRHVVDDLTLLRLLILDLVLNRP